MNLLYSNILPLGVEENQETVTAYLEKHPEMRKQAVDFNQAAIPTQVKIDEGTLQIYPDDFGTDGFFICTMEKKMQ